MEIHILTFLLNLARTINKESLSGKINLISGSQDKKKKAAAR